MAATKNGVSSEDSQFHSRWLAWNRTFDGSSRDFKIGEVAEPLEFKAQPR
jgi:hypothetical protein